MGDIKVVHGNDRDAWTALVNPPGQIPSAGREQEVFTSPNGGFTTGFWEREPDTWSFERTFFEVALILEGAADIEEPDGTVHSVRPGDVLVSPKGAKGTWHIHEKIVKFYAISNEG